MPPGAGARPGLATSGDACPRCRSTDVHRPTFTWWGGLLGPRLFKHAICRGCGLGFNWKTGKSNATAIGVYFAVGIALAILIVILRASL
jgi:hypothetical protein